MGLKRYIDNFRRSLAEWRGPRYRPELDRVVYDKKDGQLLPPDGWQTSRGLPRSDPRTRLAGWDAGKKS